MKKLTGILIIVLVLTSLNIAQAADIQLKMQQALANANVNPIENKEITFSDVLSTRWSYDSIRWGVDKELVSGYLENGVRTFKPTAQIIESEFITVLARFTNVQVGQKLKEHWAQHFYNALEPYGLPLKGYNNKVAKNTALSRGQIARIVAAKNGFNLDERQAIYYMYENDISYGLIPGTLSFESYGKDDAVTREQIPAFFQRIEAAGTTTFMGKPSNIKPNEVGGIANVPKDNTVITDEKFKELEKIKLPDKVPSGTLGTIVNPVEVGSNAGFQKWHEVAKANPDVANKMIGKVNGIITPVSLNVTKASPEDGHILSTSLDNQTIKSGFQDKDLFFEIIDKHWTNTILDTNQINHIKKGVEAYLNVSGGKTDLYAVKGQKYDLVLGLGKTSINVSIYAKGWVDAAGIDVRK